MAKLIYVIGASGVGKDTLLSALRERAPARLVAHRYITRRPAPGENHVALSETEFDYRQAAGLFFLHWHAHSLRYGLGIEIEAWLARGHDVIVNGSRAHLQNAQQRFGGSLLPLLITADLDAMHERLRQRGRESGAAIQARLDRSRHADVKLSGDIVRIDNSGSLASGVKALEQVIDAAVPRRPPLA